jgi:hypothetical protein
MSKPAMSNPATFNPVMSARPAPAGPSLATDLRNTDLRNTDLRNTDLGKKLAGLLSLTLVLSACPQTDRGRPCKMPRKTDAGTVFITEAQVRARTGTGSNATRDFLAFGSLDCDSLLCIRDATFVSDAGDNEDAQGYCSNACDLGAACPSYDPRLDDIAATRLNCRPLLLDAQTLAVINQDPAAKALINNVQSEFFCARGSTPDAGM